MAEASVGKMLDGFPGGEQVERYILRRVHREAAKLSEAKLQEFLSMIRQLADATLTGVQFDELMEDGGEAPA